MFAARRLFQAPTPMLRHVRRLATVTGSTGRQMPQVARDRSTPISHDRATFTIRVCISLANIHYAVLILSYRMAQSFMADLLGLAQIFLEKQSSPPLLWATPSL